MRLLAFVLIAYAVLLGLAAPRRFPRLFLRWIFVPVVAVIILQSAMVDVSQGEHVWGWLLFVVIGLLFLLVRLLLGTAIGQHLLGHFLYDVLKAVVRVPFRFVGWLMRRR